MKVTISILLLILVSSCKEKTISDKAHFDFIEITRDNGWTGGTTVYIDSNWIINRCDYKIITYIDSASCYVDTLDIEIRHLINSKIDSLKMISIDTLYDGHCQDCGGYIIKLGYDRKIIKSIIIDDHFNNEIASFGWFISSIMINQNYLDSIIIFETTRLMIPSAPIFQTRKYLPPPDSLIEKY